MVNQPDLKGIKARIKHQILEAMLEDTAVWPWYL